MRTKAAKPDGVLYRLRSRPGPQSTVVKVNAWIMSEDETNSNASRFTRFQLHFAMLRSR